MAVEFIHGGHDAVLEFLFGCDADMAQHGAGELGEKALDEVEPGTMLGRESEFEAAGGLNGEPSLGLFGDVRRMIVEDQLDRRMGRIGGIEELEKFDEFATAMAVISYDEKPGIQAIGAVAPDLRPVPGTHPTISRDHEYKRHGTVSLLAGIDLLTGQVHALVRDRHRSREFIEFLQLLDAAYPTHTAIKLILDNQSAHISKETRAWLADQPAGRFEFVFTPKHGSWLNLIEGFFSKLARSVL